VPVRPGRDDVDRQPVACDQDRAREALLAALHGRPTGHLAAARGRADAATHGQVLEVQAEQALIRRQGQGVDLLRQAGRGPLLQATPDRPS
jgi:hypothetical protein